MEYQLLIVNKDTDGLSIRDYPTVDGSRASELTFENVQVSKDNLIGEEGKGSELIELIVDETIAAICSEAIGAMKVLNDATVEYCKTRKQFGQPIGKFQVLQHRMVDMFMQYEQSVSMTYMVNLKLDEDYSEKEEKQPLEQKFKLLKLPNLLVKAQSNSMEAWV